MDGGDDADGATPTARRRRRRRDADGAVGRRRTEQEPRVEHGARHHRPAGVGGAARGAKSLERSTARAPTNRAATDERPEPRAKPKSGRRRKLTRCLSWDSLEPGVHGPRGRRVTAVSVGVFSNTPHQAGSKHGGMGGVCAHCPMTCEPAGRNVRGLTLSR